MRIIHTPGGVFIRSQKPLTAPTPEDFIRHGARVSETANNGLYFCVVETSKVNAWYCETQFGMSGISAAGARARAFAGVAFHWLRSMRLIGYWGFDRYQLADMARYLESWGFE